MCTKLPIYDGCQFSSFYRSCLRRRRLSDATEWRTLRDRIDRVLGNIAWIGASLVEFRTLPANDFRTIAAIVDLFREGLVLDAIVNRRDASLVAALIPCDATAPILRFGDDWVESIITGLRGFRVWALRATFLISQLKSMRIDVVLRVGGEREDLFFDNFFHKFGSMNFCYRCQNTYVLNRL